jgi:hypothetical protein
VGELDDDRFLTALGVAESKRPVVRNLDDTTREVEEASPDTVKIEPTAARAPSGVTAANILRHPDAHPIALDMLLLRQYGPEWMLWEGDTLQRVVPVDFHTETLSDLNLAKLQACRTLHLVDTYWQRWEVFGWCTTAFNSEFPDFDVMQVPSVAQVLESLDVANRIRDDVSFSDEVKGYVGAVFRHDDIFVILPPADFAHVEAPDMDLDVALVKERWPSVRASGHPPAAETAVDEQLRRLSAAHGYLEESRERLRQQLRILADV